MYIIYIMEPISWKIIETYFKDNTGSLVAHHLDSYNDFMEHGIAKIFKENNPFRYIEADTAQTRGSVEILMHLGGKDGKKIYFGKPVIYDENRSHFMYPNDARLRNMTYGTTIHYDVEIDIVTKKGTDEEVIETRELNKVYLGKFPIMLKSNTCILHDLAPDVCYNMGECRNDYGGYFIIDGKEKLIIPQETFADNMLYVRKYKDDNTYSYSAEIRSVSEDTSKAVRKTAVMMVAPSTTMSNGQIVVDIPNVRKPIPLFILMRALGVISDRDIIQHCVLDMKKNERYVDYFIPSVHDANKIFTQQTALEFIATFTKRQTISYVLDILMNYFIPHIGANNYLDKAYFIGYMVVRMLRVYTSEDNPTDRDNFKYKRIQQSGRLLYDLFREYYLVQKRGVLLELDRNFTKDAELNFPDFFKIRDVETGTRKAFKGNWGSQSYTKKVGVVQDVNRLSWNSFISQLRKLNLPLDASAKVVGPRHLNGSQWGFIDPLDTPDGGNIGLHKHMSILAYITSGGSSYPLIQWLRSHIPMKILNECSAACIGQQTKIFVNGTWIGVVNEPLVTLSVLKTMRRNGVLPVYTSISFDYKMNELHLYTDGGRLSRPIYYMHDSKPSFDKGEFISKLNDGTMTWNQIVSGIKEKKIPYSIKSNEIHDPIELYGEEKYDVERYGAIVEYLDTAEEEYALIATYEQDLKKNNRYTHIEIHPSVLLGVMGNMIIYPEHNPYARNAFSCGQSKQAVSVYHSNYQMRIDKMGVLLNYAQIPLLKSRYLDLINHEQQPYGVNAIVAIMSYTGYNVEDAILINKGAVDRGIFRTTYYSMYEAREESSKIGDGMSNSHFADVSKQEVTGLKKGYDYGYLDKHGIIKEGTPLNEKMIVIGKVNTSQDSKTDESVKPKKGQLGYVDKAFITDGEEGFRIAKVRIREERIPAIGDKMASRAGQKGTIGLIIPEEDMPYTPDGIRPDLIINPHAIPSRMTIGQLVETLFGKACCMYGGFGDCTAYTTMGPNVKTYGDMLTKIGFHSSGNQILYNGMTGEQLSSDIYIGPTYYMRLKHMVKDKINYRARGPNNALTRQSVHGRANDGGLRIGEMERDGVVSHGMSHFLAESFLDRADEYFMAVCNKTGTISIYNPNENIFLSPMADGPVKFYTTLDGNQNIEQITKYGRSFSILRIPYSFKLLIQELQVMNVQFRIITDKNVDTLTSLNYSDNIIKLTNDKIVFEAPKEGDYLSEYVERYKRMVDKLVSEISMKHYKDVVQDLTPTTTTPVPTASDSYHPISSADPTERSSDDDSVPRPAYSPVTPPMAENAPSEAKPPVSLIPASQGMVNDGALSLNTSSSSTSSFVPPPPKYSSDELNEIYNGLSGDNKAQIDKLPVNEQIDVLKKVSAKRGPTIAESENMPSILEVEPDVTEKNDGNDEDASDNDKESSSSGGASKKVNFQV